MRGNRGQVMVATPSHSGTLWVDYHNSMIHSMVAAANSGWSVQLNCMTGNSLITLARAILTQDFMESDSDILFFIDSDLRWPPEAFVRLCNSPHDVICGVYPCRQPTKKFPMRGLFNGHDYLYQTRGCQGGFLRVTRSAIEQMQKAYPEMMARDRKRNRTMFMLFDPMIVDKEPLGEDFSFCERWIKMGGKVWIDPDITFGHFGSQVFEGNLSTDQVH